MLLPKQTLGDSSITLLLRNKVFSSPGCTVINSNALQEEGKNYFLTLKMCSTLPSDPFYVGESICHPFTEISELPNPNLHELSSGTK